MELIQMLKDDHQRVKQMLQECVSQDVENLDENMIHTICREAQLHMLLEEECLYPVLENIDEIKDLISEAYEEHSGAKRICERIEQRKNFHVQGVMKDLESLLEDINHHVEEEENELFPQLPDLLSQDQIQEIQDSMLRIKQREMGKSRV